LADDSTVLESQPLEKLASEGELAVFKHDGYWQCMDTARDVISIQQDAMLNPKPWLNRLA
jgi:glucose-1-phosphate cytidylyltransferase